MAHQTLTPFCVQQMSMISDEAGKPTPQTHPIQSSSHKADSAPGTGQHRAADRSIVFIIDLHPARPARAFRAQEFSERNYVGLSHWRS